MADSPRGALVARLTEKGAAIDTQLLFFGLELAALEDEQAEALLATTSSSAGATGSAPCGSSARTSSPSRRRRSSPRSRSPGSSAWDRLYDELLGAIKVDLDGDRDRLRGGDGEALLGATATSGAVRPRP